MSLRWTESDLARLQLKLAGPVASSTPAKPSKYRNIREVVDGISFHSKLEARLYRELKVQRDAKLIKTFCRQVRIDLPGDTSVVVDFMVLELNDRARWIDAKGFETALFKLKRAQALELYGIEIELWPAR